MPRLELLIVENDPPTIDALKHRFTQVFADSVLIWQASTIESGQKIVRARGAFLAGAILDFHLPSELRRRLEIDMTLCKEMGEHAAQAAVFHYTGFSDDQLVIDHYRKFHTGAGFYFYNKVSPTDAEKLKGDVAGALFSNRAREILSALVGPPDDRFAKHQPTAGPVTSRDAFLSAIELGTIIERGWKYLGADIKRQAVSSLHVVEHPGGARVSLIDTNSLQYELTEAMPAGRFELRWHPGSFFSSDSVDHELITTYYASLASLSQEKDGGLRIPVFVHHIGGIFPQHDASFTDLDLDLQPYIVLPVWRPGSFNVVEARAAAGLALREGSRAVSLSSFGRRRPPVCWWWWIDAVAEMDRTLTLGGTIDDMYIPRAKPGHPIDQPQQLLDAALFLEFLKLSQQEYNPSLLGDVISLAPQFSGPWEATEAVAGECFLNGIDLFADFARQAFFRKDPMSYLSYRAGLDHFPDDVRNLDDDTQPEFRGHLDHLSRIYCQFESRSTSGSFELTVSAESKSAKRWLRIELCPQDDDGRCTRIYRFQTEQDANDPDKVVWRHEPILFESETRDDGDLVQKTWILIISNSGFDERADRLDFIVTPTVTRARTTTA